MHLVMQLQRFVWKFDDDESKTERERERVNRNRRSEIVKVRRRVKKNMLIENNKTWIAGKGGHFKHLTAAFEFRWKSEAASFTNNRAYSPNEQLGEDCSWSVCCICCCGCWSVCCCCCVIWESILVDDRNNECVWLCGCCGCWNWKCCCEVNRSIGSFPVSMLWNWLLWFGFGIKLRLAASRLLRDCFDGNSQLSNILIDVDGSSNRNNPFVTQLPVKCCCVWFVFDSGCDWFGWLFWDCFATASKIVAIYNIRGQTGFDKSIWLPNYNSSDDRFILSYRNQHTRMHSTLVQQKSGKKWWHKWNFPWLAVYCFPSLSLWILNVVHVC